MPIQITFRRLSPRRRGLALAVSAVLAAGAATPASAEELWSHQTVAPYAIIVDATTGDVLMAKEADAPIPTASLSKLMTALLAFEALESGVITLDGVYDVSRAAFRAGQDEVGDDSLMWLNLGDQPTMDDLLRGLIIASGNDAAIAIAEAISGSEALFVRRMNAKAEDLGLTNSRFANASGVDADSHEMSVRDLATLARHMIDDYPQYYFYYSELEYTWLDNPRQVSRNPLLGTYDGADGMKTGFTDNARFGIVGTAERDGRRVIVVLSGIAVDGIDSPDPAVRERAEREGMRVRAVEIRRALDWAFSRFEIVTVAQAGDVVGAAEVWLGEAETVPAALTADLVMSMPKEVFADEISAVIRYEGPIRAPIEAGQEIGELVITVPGMPPRAAPVVAAEAVAEGGYGVRLEAAAGWALDRIMSPGVAAPDDASAQPAGEGAPAAQ